MVNSRLSQGNYILVSVYISPEPPLPAALLRVHLAVLQEGLLEQPHLALVLVQLPAVVDLTQLVADL